MKRFLLVLALVAVAGATYAATAPGSQTRGGPTTKQFKALQKQVTALKKQVKLALDDTNGLGSFVLHCMAHGPVPVDSVGDTTTGYLFGPASPTPPASATTTSALALDTSGTPLYRLFTVNQTDTACVFFINNAAGRHGAHRFAIFAKH